MAGERWVCLDVGETLIDETRVWQIWADELRIPRLTFMAAIGAAIALGHEHGDAFALLRRPDWVEHRERVEQAYGGFSPEDLYPDALRAFAALRDQGYRLAVLANQPARRTAELRALGVQPEVIAMSDELDLSKPDPAFFRRALELMSNPEPSAVAYVGDRVDNDVLPSAAAGMRAVWLRRGPWSVIVRDVPAEAALVVDSLDELVERIDECWSELAA
ncbi:MAG: HAD family hydrolase [Chloroflexota bacterium]|nr:HAD family hydrolase [Chloroflexota bacterium]